MTTYLNADRAKWWRNGRSDSGNILRTGHPLSSDPATKCKHPCRHVEHFRTDINPPPLSNMPTGCAHCVFSLDTAVARGSIYFPAHSYDKTFFGMVEEHYHGLVLTNTADYPLAGIFFRLWAHYRRLWKRNERLKEPKSQPGKSTC